MSPLGSPKATDNELPLSEIGKYGVLNGLYQAWQKACDTDIPVRLDPLDLPKSALPHVMLVDLTESPRNAVIRLAGTLPCDLYGRELKNTSIFEFFSKEDADKTLDDLFQTAVSGEPMLTDRSYVGINGKNWTYIRLLLPLNRQDGRATRILKAIEPFSFKLSDSD